MSQRSIFLFIIISLVSILILQKLIGNQLLVYYNNLATNIHYIHSNNYTVYIIYTLIYLILVAIGLPLIGPLSLIGGRFFGMYWATLLSLISIVIGSIFYVYALKFFFKKYLHTNANTLLNKFQKNISIYGYWYFLVLHFMVMVPLCVINTMIALEKIPFLTFATITFIGSIPAVALYSYAGDTLGSIHTFADILEPKFVIATLLCILIASIPILMTYIKKHKERLQP